ncbi:hypothetical protein ACIBH1_45740 [Nonomuraea sp. NPDC050663]|uniref:hypothetical protein n=1 Tax=Nonomuraea sp. NPDC050663 TaxID=3364370 RepID=UPI00379863DD
MNAWNTPFDLLLDLLVANAGSVVVVGLVVVAAVVVVVRKRRTTYKVITLDDGSAALVFRDQPYLYYPLSDLQRQMHEGRLR